MYFRIPEKKIAFVSYNVDTKFIMTYHITAL